MRRGAFAAVLVVVITALIISGCGGRGESTSTTESDTAAGETAASMPRGTEDPNIQVDLYDPDKACDGTTIFADAHDAERPRIVEVNMLGEVVWEYLVPPELAEYSNPGFDVEVLPDDNVLFVLPRNGIYEIDRGGNVVWSHSDGQVTHDADRLPSGNTLYVFGGGDRADDAQVKEVSPEGELVWSWYAGDHFNRSPYADINDQGWTHTNAVTRMDDGNTLISLRNLDLMVEVDPGGAVVRTIGEGVVFSPHDPEVLSSGNILLISQEPLPPNNALEIEPDTGAVVWQFGGEQWRPILARDADRLPNGNTLLTGTSEIIEVTAGGEIVWRLKLEGEGLDGPGSHTVGLYKAERTGSAR